MNQLLIQYSYLQVLDFLTTVAFLLHGVEEANPLVRVALRYSSSHPFTGLLVVKALAIGMGLCCWHRGRGKLLVRINILFATVVAWNLAALIVASLKLGG